MVTYGFLVLTVTLTLTLTLTLTPTLTRFKIPNIEIDKEAGKFYSNWDEENKVFVLQLYFKKGGAQAPRSAPPSLMQPGMPAAPPTG